MSSRRPFTVVPVVPIAGLFIASLLGPHLFAGQHDPSGQPCAGCATGQCQVGSPHGYWKPTWRRWPGATTYRGFHQAGPPVDTPSVDVPDALDEVRIEGRTRSDEPLESPSVPENGPAMPTLPDDTTTLPFDSPSNDGFSLPDTSTPPPSDVPAETSPGFDNLFDGLSPPAETPPDNTPSDNLFDDLDLGAASGPLREPKVTISQRSIKSRRVSKGAAQLAVLEAIADRESPDLPQLVPPHRVSKASHFEEVQPAESSTNDVPEPSADNAMPSTGNGNPLRSVTNAARAPAQESSARAVESPRQLDLPQASAASTGQTSLAGSNAVSLKRLQRTTLRANPLRAR